MKHAKLTLIGLLASTAAISDAFAFGPPLPPIGGPPMGGPPHPPIGGGMPATPFGGGPPHPPMGGGPAFSGNVFEGPRGPAGNFSGNLAARGPTGNAVNSGNTVNLGAGRYYGNGDRSGNYGRGYGYYSGGYGSYRNGSYGERRYWGAYAAGVATGAAEGEAASSDNSSKSYYYYTPPYYYYTCWDASTGSYYSSAVQCSQ
jgi:hypothetical protein